MIELVSLTTKVFLMVTIVLYVPSAGTPGGKVTSPPISHQMQMEDEDECWDMARELTKRAETGPLRSSGGFFTASCQVQVEPSIDH